MGEISKEKIVPFLKKKQKKMLNFYSIIK